MLLSISHFVGQAVVTLGGGQQLGQLFGGERERELDVVHLGWSVSILLFVINFWWWEFGLSELGALDFRLFVFVIFYASCFISSARCSSPTT